MALPARIGLFGSARFKAPEDDAVEDAEDGIGVFVAPESVGALALAPKPPIPLIPPAPAMTGEDAMEGFVCEPEWRARSPRGAGDLGRRDSISAFRNIISLLKG